MPIQASQAVLLDSDSTARLLLKTFRSKLTVVSDGENELQNDEKYRVSVIGQWADVYAPNRTAQEAGFAWAR